MADASLKQCKCRIGCTAVVYGVRTRYAVGHSPACHTREVHRKIGLANSIALKGRRLSKELREKVSVGIRNSQKFKEGMKRRSLPGSHWRKANAVAGRRRRGKSRPFSDKQARNHRIALARPETKERMSRRMVETWKDSEFRKKVCVKISKALIGKKRGPLSLKHKLAIGKAEKLAYREGRHPGGGPNGWHVRRYEGKVYRSSYEIAFVRWLRGHHIEFEYEQKMFVLPKTTYKPDFYLPAYDVWIEIKGYHSEQFWRKVVAFHRLYPDEKLLILDHVKLCKYGVL